MERGALLWWLARELAVFLVTGGRRRGWKKLSSLGAGTRKGGAAARVPWGRGGLGEGETPPPPAVSAGAWSLANQPLFHRSLSSLGWGLGGTELVTG